MSGSNFCCFICIQVSQEAGKVIWYSHFLKNSPQFVVIHTVKGFSIVNEAEGDVFLEFPCFLHDPVNVDSFTSCFSDISKPSLYIWKFSVHIVLESNLRDSEHNLAGMWHGQNCAVAGTFYGIAFLWDWNENWLFPVLWPLLSFLNLLTSGVQYFNSIIL